MRPVRRQGRRSRNRRFSISVLCRMAGGAKSPMAPPGTANRSSRRDLGLSHRACDRHPALPVSRPPRMAEALGQLRAGIRPEPGPAASCSTGESRRMPPSAPTRYSAKEAGGSGAPITGRPLSSLSAAAHPGYGSGSARATTAGASTTTQSITCPPQSKTRSSPGYRPLAARSCHAQSLTSNTGTPTATSSPGSTPANGRPSDCLAASTRGRKVPPCRQRVHQPQPSASLRLAVGGRDGGQDRDAGPATIGHLDPNGLVSGCHGYRADAARDRRAAMPHRVGHQFAGQQERQVYVRVRLAEHPRHEGTGRPHLLGHRRDRHALAELCRAHQGHQPSLARLGPDGLEIQPTLTSAGIQHESSGGWSWRRPADDLG